MKITSYYPVLAVTDVAATAEFYRRVLPFVSGYESDWYVHLVSPGRPHVNLAIVDCRHDSVPSSARRPVQGLLLNFEVEDVDGAFEAVRKLDVPVVLTLRDEPWGQRHFIVQDPNGILIDVIKPIRPTAEFADYYVGAEASARKS
jgi:catechol 2,3-dioxygenase-like lactoylglutathione lyase family enzyme